MSIRVQENTATPLLLLLSNQNESGLRTGWTTNQLWGEDFLCCLLAGLPHPRLYPFLQLSRAETRSPRKTLTKIAWELSPVVPELTLLSEVGEWKQGGCCEGGRWGEGYFHWEMCLISFTLRETSAVFFVFPYGSSTSCLPLLDLFHFPMSQRWSLAPARSRPSCPSVRSLSPFVSLSWLVDFSLLLLSHGGASVVAEENRYPFYVFIITQIKMLTN